MATVVNLRDSNLPLPAFLLFDASILLATRSVPGAPVPPRSADAIQFLRRVQQACHNGNTIPLVCVLTLEECYFKIIQWRYQNDPSLSPQRTVVAAQLGRQPNQVGWHELCKHHPRFIQNCFPELQAFFQFVIGIPLTILEPEDLASPNVALPSIAERMRHYIHSCCILPKDALLIAIADRLGVQHIATLEKDFNRLGVDFTVYTLP